MSMTVKLSDELLAEAKRHASAFSRSVPKQIEHWAKIGRIAEDNPDLPYSFIAGILLAKQEVEDAQVTPYQFG
jgi:hypothetical protein